jgi:hypothetical protein
MSLGLVLALSQVKSEVSVSAIWIVTGVLAWVAALVATVSWISSRMQREVRRIRAATGTDDAAFGSRERAWRFRVDRPAAYESKLRFLGLPLLAVAYGSTETEGLRGRSAVGWIAIGDAAFSPLLAIGGLAVAPCAVGAVTAGVFSLSLWGAALGVLSFGSVAVGFWAYGLGAIGWRSAFGAAAVARDFAVGVVVRAAEANTPAAKEWFASQWLRAPLDLLAHETHWLVLLVLLMAVVLGAHRSSKRRAPRR